MTRPYAEEAFETAIVTHLLDHGGYLQRESSDYDRERAMLPGDVVGYLQETQPKPWGKVQAIHGDKLEGVLLDALGKALAQQGSLHVLRHGFGFYGQTFKLCTFQPAHGLNPQVEERYKANRVVVVRQLRYELDSEKSLDLALFINGIPVVTVELKTPMTGQSAVVDAQKQYKYDRSPNSEIFRFKRRALVHFAVDPDEAWMTTRLNGASTFFLPFNRGHGTAPGNPPVEGNYRTYYLWEEVWQRDSLLDIMARFVYLEKDDKKKKEGGKSKETMIFPRYHQLDVVRRLVQAACTDGPGTNYLVQHSAGSGKSNSIAWLAYRLSSLYRGDDSRVFDSVVVLTDRRVLDQQLQETIYDIEHKTGVVVPILSKGVKSKKLAEALETKAAIIICTIHSFGFVKDKIASLPERNYAVIVDEAHSSQGGDMAAMVKEVLSEANIDASFKEAVDDDDHTTPDQLALRAAISRGRQPNLSYFAFTATPKYKTLEVFGHKGEDGKPAPFHLYSMRQAIEEGFILDVLRGYTSYSRYFELVKRVADDPELDKRKAAKAAVRFVNLHPTNIAQKTEIIIEHFRTNIRPLLAGRAKAMVITGSRLEAVRYKLAFDEYVREKGYRNVQALVAFSGKLQDPDTPGVTYTEPEMNNGLKESELPRTLAGDDYNVLLVAEKYQTGFDQPLLCAMYVDKRLSGIHAVQTLSRLNRTHKGKDRTFVLDFVNKFSEILEPFQQFYEEARIDEVVDPQRMYELQHRLSEFQVYLSSEVDQFASVFFKLGRDQAVTDNQRLNAAMAPAKDRFNALEEEQQDEFRKVLRSYTNLYSYLAQTVPFQDAELEKLYAFGRFLLRVIGGGKGAGPLDLGDEIALKSLVLKKRDEQDLQLVSGDGTPLTGPTATGTHASRPSEVKLSEVITLINSRFGTDFDAQDLVDGVTQQLVEDESIQQAANANDKDHFSYTFNPKLNDALLSRHSKHADFINHVFSDPDIGGLFRSLMLEKVYGRARATEGA